jgi:glycosyltransferase involved in cell wall biosynthesis
MREMTDIRPLRILHSEAATSFGGQEHRIFKEMVAMRERGHYLEAVCQPDAELTKRLRDAGFVVHTMYMDGVVNITSGIFKIWRILQRGKFDVVNTHSRQDTIIAAPAARLAKTPLIVRTRHLASRVNSLLTYTWLPHCVTTVSKYVRQQLIDRGVPAARVESIYTPVVLEQPVEHSTLRQELGLKDTDVIVGCVAVLRPNKGHRALLDAIAPLMEIHPDLHLVIVGGGSPVFEQLVEKIEELKLSSRIHLLGTRRDVPNLLAGFDVFCLPTRQEAMGTAFVEAAASGLAVIGTDVGGVGEMLVNEQTGILVPLDDLQALRTALARLIENPPLRAKMGQTGKDRIWKEGIFSTETLARRTEEVYSNWLSSTTHRN